MQRRTFIKALGALLGVAAGTVAGAGAVLAETKQTKLASGGPISRGNYLIGERAGGIGTPRPYYGSVLPEIHVGQVNGHVERIWFNDELVYQSAISKHADHG